MPMITPRQAWHPSPDDETESAPLQTDLARDNFFNAYWRHGIRFGSPTTRLLLLVAVDGFIFSGPWNSQRRDALEFGRALRIVIMSRPI